MLLWFVHLVGAWHVVPPLWWTVALVAAAVGMARVTAWWPRLPTTAGSRPRRIRATAGSLAFYAVIAGVVLWATA